MGRYDPFQRGEHPAGVQTFEVSDSPRERMLAASSPDAEATAAIFESMKPSAELCPGEHAYAMIQGLGLAHMDASLRGNEDASKLLAGDPAALLAARGIEAYGIG